MAKNTALQDLPDDRVKIDLNKLVELRMQGMKSIDLAQYFKCSRQAIHQALKRYTLDPKNLKDYRKTKADRMELLQGMIVTSIDESVIKKASFLQRVTGAGILEDKIRLIRGESTENINIRSVVARCDGELDEAKVRLAELREGVGSVTTATPYIVGQDGEAEGVEG